MALDDKMSVIEAAAVSHRARFLDPLFGFVRVGLAVSGVSQHTDPDPKIPLRFRYERNEMDIKVRLDSSSVS